VGRPRLRDRDHRSGTEAQSVSGDVNDQERASQRAQAITSVLATPLLDRANAAFTFVAVHEQWLCEWFREACGWDLYLDRRRGFARLRKVGLRLDTRRAPATRRTSPALFERRRYVLLCIVAAVLGEHGRSRISLRDIAEGVTDFALRAAVTPYDAVADSADRRALHDAVQLLVDQGILTERDREGGDFVRDMRANVLFEIDDRRLAHLIAAPIPPAVCATWRDMLEDASASDLSQDNDEIRPTAAELRVRALQRVMRRLLDDPVCLLSDLTADDLAVARGDAERIAGWLADAGLVLEMRGDLWAAVDVDERAGQRCFPVDTIPSHAALMVLDHLCAESGDAWVPASRPMTVIEDLMREYPRWARSWRGKSRPTQLVKAALRLLTDHDLIRAEADGWRATPAAWRWRACLQPDPDLAEVPSLDEDEHDPFQETLFTEETQ
jgi:uncharacterized protein (TIGR02678 family)